MTGDSVKLAAGSGTAADSRLDLVMGRLVRALLSLPVVTPKLDTSISTLFSHSFRQAGPSDRKCTAVPLSIQNHFG